MTEQDNITPENEDVEGHKRSRRLRTTTTSKVTRGQEGPTTTTTSKATRRLKKITCFRTTTTSKATRASSGN